MPRRLAAFGALVMMAAGSVALMRSRADAQSVPPGWTGADIFDTGSIECATLTSGGTFGDVDWMPNVSVPLRIKAWQTWTGMDPGAVADVVAIVSVIGPGETGSKRVAYTSIDHYADPSQTPADRIVFAPEYITIPAYGGLRLHYGCTSYTGRTDLAPNTMWPTHVHYKGLLWFTVG